MRKLTRSDIYDGSHFDDGNLHYHRPVAHNDNAETRYCLISIYVFLEYRTKIVN